MQRINPKVFFSPNCHTKGTSGGAPCFPKAMWPASMLWLLVSAWLRAQFLLEPTIGVASGSKGLPLVNLETECGEQQFFTVVSKGRSIDLRKQCTNGASCGHHEQIAIA